MPAPSQAHPVFAAILYERALAPAVFVARHLLAAPAMRAAEQARWVAAALARDNDADADGWFATDLGCPDCSGVLQVAVFGPRRYLRFRCRVGHAFSGETLLEAKEEQLERALFSAGETLE